MSPDRKVFFTIVLMSLVIVLLLISAKPRVAEVKAKANSVPDPTAVIDDAHGWVTVNKITYDNKTYHVFRWDTPYGAGVGSMEVIPIDSPAQQEVKDK